MPTIKASCEDCGDVNLTSVDVVLYIATHTDGSYYEFRCPLCKTQVRKPADDIIVSLLLSGNVRHEILHIPFEYIERKPDLDLTDGCVEEFVKELNRTHLISLQAQLEAPQR